MINISKLYCDQVTPGDWIRYGKRASGERPGDVVPKQASERRPIVVWNITRACNLKCVHCYNDSGSRCAEDELSTQEAKEVLRDLAAFGVPTVLFSGGEPLMRKDLFEMLASARELGLRTVISTNGTLITAEIADKIKEHGVSYVGISLDGIGPINDKFRGVEGAFDKAVEGIRKTADNFNVTVEIAFVSRRSRIEHEMAQKQKIPKMARPKWFREKQRQRPLQNPARQEHANDKHLPAETPIL